MKNFTLKRGRAGLTALLVGLLTLVFLGQTGSVWAHARFKSATILPDSTISSVPTQLSLTFSQETSPAETTLRVLDSTGATVDKGDLTVFGPTITISLGTLADGKYTVRFRSFTEDDSGVVTGEYAFTVAKNGANSQGNASPTKQVETYLPGKEPKSSSTGFILGLGVGAIIVVVATIWPALWWRNRQRRRYYAQLEAKRNEERN